MDEHGEIIIYQAQDGLAGIDVRVADETVWLTQQQMAESSIFRTSMRKANWMRRQGVASIRLG